MGFEYKSTEIIGKNLEKVNAELAQKANEIDVATELTTKRDKTTKLVMEDMDDEVVSAMTGGATVDVLSIPQDYSVSKQKLNPYVKNIVDKVGYFESLIDLSALDFKRIVNATLDTVTNGYQVTNSGSGYGWASIDEIYNEVEFKFSGTGNYYIIGASDTACTAIGVKGGTTGRILEFTSSAYTELQAAFADATTQSANQDDWIKIKIDGNMVYFQIKRNGSNTYVDWFSYDMSNYTGANAFNSNPCLGIHTTSTTLNSQFLYTKLNGTLTDYVNQKAELKDNDIYLIGHFGQSNADGRATGTRPLNMSEDVYMVKNLVNKIVTNGSDYQDDESSSGWFAQGLHLLSGKRVAIAKWALGGTSLVPTDTDSWNPATTGTCYYDSALEMYQIAKSELEKIGYNVIQVGFVWTQGEADAKNNRTTTEYTQALQDLIQAFRTDLGVTDFKCFINELGIYNVQGSDDTPYVNIRTAQNDVANIDNNAFVISDVAKKFASWDLNYMQDNDHYTKDGYVLLGKQGSEYAYKYLFNEMHNPQYKKVTDKNFIDSLYA